MDADRVGSRAPDGGSEAEGAKTSPGLLDRVRDWGDHPAWAEFHDQYDPMLRRWCRRFSFDGETSDELCQRIWVELMARMKTFRYDPSRGFRKWLWRLFHSRSIDLLRRRHAEASAPYGFLAPEVLANVPDREADEPDAPAPSPALVVQAEAAQAAVRARVDEGTWSAYWMVAIEDRSIRDAAEALGKSYTAVYTGYKRVDRMLRAEGERRLTAM